MGEEMIPIVAIIATFGVPLVWILTAHQRKMAEIIHRTHQQQGSSQVEAVTQEVRDLRQMVIQQSIALDNLTTEVRKALPAAGSNETLSTRLGKE